MTDVPLPPYQDGEIEADFMDRIRDYMHEVCIAYAITDEGLDELRRQAREQRKVEPDAEGMFVSFDDLRGLISRSMLTDDPSA